MSESWYDRHVLPYLINAACGMRPFGKQRAKVVPLAHGRVMEVGIGTGLNMPFYERARVQSIVGVDPSLNMHPLALKRIQASGIPVQLVGLSAERLQVEDASFDSMVCTYTLCSIPDPVSALKEMRRALVPGGRLFFSEHGRAPDPEVVASQTRWQPMWKKIAGGCELNRDIPALLEQAGFTVSAQSRYLRGPRLFSYHYWGEASA